MRGVAVGALLVLLFVTGCASATPSKPANLPSRESTTGVPSSPSAAFIAQPVEAGWIREVGETDGLVLVFETPSAFSVEEKWPLRFVLFNETGRDLTWDAVRFGVRMVGSRDPGLMVLGFPYMRDGMVPDQPLALRSGESTTHEVTRERLGIQSSQQLEVHAEVRAPNQLIAEAATLTVDVR